jgi:hypothetical protein
MVLEEHAPRSEHDNLHQDIGHIRENHLQATLLLQLSKYAHASGVYLQVNRLSHQSKRATARLHM